MTYKEKEDLEQLEWCKEWYLKKSLKKMHWSFCKSYIKATWKEFKLMLQIKM